MSFIHDKTGQRETHFIKRTFTVYTGDEKHVLLSHFNLGNIQISRKKEHLPQWPEARVAVYNTVNKMGKFFWQVAWKKACMKIDQFLKYLYG